MDPLNAFLNLLAKTEGRDKVICFLLRLFDLSNMQLYIRLMIKSKGLLLKSMLT